MITGFAGGTEDVVFRHGGREVFVSSADFREPARGGHIYRVDVTEDTPPVDVTPKLDFPFLPHGIDLYLAADGSERLFVVNHRGGSGFTQATHADVSHVEHTVEAFDVTADGGLRFVATYRGPELVSPNDVAAVGPDRFYVTNDHGYGPGLPRKFEDWLRLPAGNVVYYDGKGFREVYGGTRYANGVKATPDGKTVYVAETTGGVLHRFSRDTSTGALTEASRVEGWIGLDNISLDADGSAWTSGHPKLLAFLSHAKHPEKRSPSQVLHFGPSAEEFYLNDGNPLSGSSVAATNGKVVVVGAVYEGKLLLLPR